MSELQRIFDDVGSYVVAEPPVYSANEQAQAAIVAEAMRRGGPVNSDFHAQQLTIEFANRVLQWLATKEEVV